MKLSSGLQQEIIDFLISLPNIRERNTQEAFISYMGLDTQLQTQIHIGIPSEQFISLLVSTFICYGTLEDGRNALDVLLETAKRYVGTEKQEYCDSLLKSYHLENTSVSKNKARQSGMDILEIELQKKDEQLYHTLKNSVPIVSILSQDTHAQNLLNNIGKLLSEKAMSALQGIEIYILILSAVYHQSSSKSILEHWEDYSILNSDIAILVSKINKLLTSESIKSDLLALDRKPIFPDQYAIKYYGIITSLPFLAAIQYLAHALDINKPELSEKYVQFDKETHEYLETMQREASFFIDHERKRIEQFLTPQSFETQFIAFSILHDLEEVLFCCNHIFKHHRLAHYNNQFDAVSVHINQDFLNFNSEKGHILPVYTPLRKGTVSEVFVEAGYQVVSGDVLCTVDTEKAELKVCFPYKNGTVKKVIIDKFDSISRNYPIVLVQMPESEYMEVKGRLAFYDLAKNENFLSFS